MLTMVLNGVTRSYSGQRSPWKRCSGAVSSSRAPPPPSRPLRATPGGGEVPTGDATIQFLEELTNVVAGVLLGRLHPDREPRLGLPIAGTGAVFASPGSVALNVDVDVGNLGVLVEEFAA